MALARRSGPTRLPGGPSGLPLLGRQIPFMRNSLTFLTEAHRDYGDLVTLPLNGSRVVAAFGPSQVAAVTGAYGKEVDISAMGGVEVAALNSDLQGRGPLNSTGKEHALYRQISLRALGGASAKAYAAVTAELTGRLLTSWTVGQQVDLLPMIGGLSRRIFKHYMFGTDIAVTDPELDRAVDRYVSIMESTVRRVGSTLIPYDIPGLSCRNAAHRSLSQVDEKIKAIEAGTVRTTHQPLATCLLNEMERLGLPRDVSLSRELMLQLYFAGITSVGSTIVWTLLLLALHPKPALGLVEELDTVLAGRLPDITDTRNLPRLEAILDESMRLYPGAAFEFKRTEEELTLDGYEIPANFPLLLAPWVTQRSPRCFDEPNSFRPDRFTDGYRTFEKGAFSPWGTGSRSCIGRALARTAIRTIVGGVTQRYRLDLVPDQRIEPHAGYFGIRLVPRPDVRVRIAPQDGDTARSAVPVAGSIVGGVPGPVGAHVLSA